MRLFISLTTAMLLSTFSTGCLSKIEGDKVFQISANRYFIGKTIEDAEAAVPEGAVITDVFITKTFFDLIQMSTISGYKPEAMSGDRKVANGVIIHEGNETFTVTGSKFIFGPVIDKVEESMPNDGTVTGVALAKGPLFGIIQSASISGTK